MAIRHRKGGDREEVQHSTVTTVLRTLQEPGGDVFTNFGDTPVGFWPAGTDRVGRWASAVGYNGVSVEQMMYYIVERGIV